MPIVVPWACNYQISPVRRRQSVALLQRLTERILSVVVVDEEVRRAIESSQYYLILITG
jgi:hypothetical protein